MARIRTIKPAFFMNEELAELPPLTRLLYIGLWTQADREGRMEDRPRRIKASVLPYDECDIDAMLEALSECGKIIRYEVSGSRYIQITNFDKHQNPHYKEVPSEIPAPDGHVDSPVVALPLTEEQRREVFERCGAVCSVCGSVDDLTVDHIYPKSLGGTNDPGNLQILCMRCNASKNNRFQPDVDSMSGQHRDVGREGKGIGREGNAREAVDELPDEKPMSSVGYPQCLAAEIDVIEPEYRGSCWGFIVGQAEAQFGGLLSHADRSELAQAITQGCIHGCTGEHPQACAIHVFDKLKLKGNTSYKTSRLWLKCIREDRMEVRR